MAAPVPINRRLELVSDVLVGQYWFRPDGHVSATLGEKEGAVCAPILEYKVISSTSVELLLEGKSFDFWTEIQCDGDVLKVKTRGQQLTFKVLS